MNATIVKEKWTSEREKKMDVFVDDAAFLSLEMDRYECCLIQLCVMMETS